MARQSKLKRAVVKEELVALTGDWMKAIILNQFIYWSERVNDFDAFIEEEKARNSDTNIELTNGWIYKSAKQLAQEVMAGSDDSVNRRLAELVEDGWIDRRTNPNYAWDRTYQYRVDIVKIQVSLQKLGFALEDYPLVTSTAPIPHGAECIPQSASSRTQTAGALPETTSETTNNKDFAVSLFTQPPNDLQAAPTASTRSRKKEPKQEQQVKGALCQPDVPGSSQAEVFGALSEVCRLDTKIKRVATQVGKAASELRAAGYTAPDVVRFGQWWYANDFRGKQGQVPGLNLIPTLIPQSRSVAPQPAVPTEHRYDVDTLRDWHKTWSYAEWNSHIAVEQGKFPADKISCGEWYASEYDGLDETGLRQWWREQEQARQETMQ